MLTHKPQLDPKIWEKQKIQLKLNQTKQFPKLMIVLDDNQCNIFFVDVEYSQIPSACGRCGALGHKEKRCLLPPNPLEDHTAKETEVANEEIPIVDIDKVLQKHSKCTY